MAADLSALLDRAEALVSERLKALGVSLKVKGEYSGVRFDYQRVIDDAIYEYLIGTDAVTTYRAAMMKGMSDAFVSAFEMAYTQGGAELPLDDDAIEWLGSRQDEEFGHIRELFTSLKALRAQYQAGEVDKAALKNETAARVDGYLATLDSVYNMGRLFAKQNEMLTWRYGDTVHCPTCEKLNGQSHRAKWYIARDYIPGKPGSAMDCGGWRCQCALLDKNGDEVTI